MLALAAELRPSIEQSSVHFEDLVLAIVDHDIIYVPGSQQSEWVSAAFYDATIRPTIDNANDGAIRSAILQTKYLSELTKVNRLSSHSYAERLSFWLQQLDLYTLIRGTRNEQLVDFVKVFYEFENICQGDKQTFEHGQNDFLKRLAEKFGFNYDPITWKEIEREDEKGSN